MNDLFAKHKNLIFIGGFVLVLVGGYYLFGSSIQLGSGAGAPAAASESEQELLNELLKLKSLQLDESIFTDPAFKSLEDFSQPIEPEAVGRKNPFMPAGGVAVPPGQTGVKPATPQDFTN